MSSFPQFPRLQHWTILRPDGPSQSWPVGRQGHSAFTLHDPNLQPVHQCLVVLCGWDGRKSLADMWIWSFQHYAWEQVS